MIFIRFVYWLLGYIIFSASGGFPERFINLCSLSGIPVRDLRLTEGVLTGKTSIEGYKKMRHAARKSGMKMKKADRRGLPFFLHDRRKRVGLLIGLVLFIVVPSILSNMIWVINITGNYDVTNMEILEILEKSGLEIGARASKLDVDRIEREAVAATDGLMWIAINIKGSSATVEIREEVKIPEIEDREKPHNLVATKDGQIVTMEAYKGTAAVDITAAVLKGDLLVAGAVENRDTSVNLVHAKGYVTARTENKISAEAEKKQLRKAYYDRKCSYSLYILGLEIPIGRVKDTPDTEYYESEWRLTVSGVRLPVGYTRRQKLYYEEKELAFGNERVRLLAAENYFCEQTKKFRWAEILTNEVTAAENENKICFSGSYTALENIGVEKPYEVDIE